jgi:hypothetical protein
MESDFCNRGGVVSHVTTPKAFTVGPNSYKGQAMKIGMSAYARQTAIRGGLGGAMLRQKPKTVKKPTKKK